VLLVAIWMAGCGEGERPAQTPKQTPAHTQTVQAARTIVAMGDSLTEGWGVEEELAYPARLEARLRSAGYDVRVINAGVSGETSSGALPGRMEC
jgi:acyl-CoA thioesterase-1